ncbi:hypothetical protein [Pigmentiphaga kullae]|uniref:hypothetical protein n=1 Tax=Pigmentiphaga kullae TaxID=151784 RepID=UPI00102D28BE|nr:hypothetical protein [Pigmentiphaga kullae]
MFILPGLFSKLGVGDIASHAAYTAEVVSHLRGFNAYSAGFSIDFPSGVHSFVADQPAVENDSFGQDFVVLRVVAGGSIAIVFLYVINQFIGSVPDLEPHADVYEYMGPEAIASFPHAFQLKWI